MLLKRLGAGESTTGRSIAALKVYLAIALSADELFAKVQVSLTQLEVLTGLSRPMVIAGIRALEELGALGVDRHGYRSTYRLIESEDRKQFSKLPRDIVRARLKNVPNGSAEALAALKVYLTLLTVRQRNSHLAPVSHRRIQAYTGIRPATIAKGTSILIEHGLVRHSNRPSFTGPDGHPVNNYYVIGVLGEHDQADDVDPLTGGAAVTATSGLEHEMVSEFEAERATPEPPQVATPLDLTSDEMEEIIAMYNST
ncbi:hypothetical protein [Agrilutibacter solisilvae]|uniref:Uncharacterized protein n=1 Tax=Agrilutibacter solisilvae TaxID=2763317 RepID=A0A975ASB5_9GAMM|nr:hypothetical protein [Lysobacter solisilvae]QSX78113.1 hypothetical protein I8J32_015660 [Lysobacter solisilvae]